MLQLRKYILIGFIGICILLVSLVLAQKNIQRSQPSSSQNTTLPVLDEKFKSLGTTNYTPKIPDTWKLYENDFFSLRIPDGFTVDTVPVSENNSILLYDKTINIDGITRAHNSFAIYIESEPFVQVVKQHQKAFLLNWAGFRPEDIKGTGLISISGNPAYLQEIIINEPGFSPIEPDPFSERRLIKKNPFNVYHIKANNSDLKVDKQFSDMLLALASSIRDKKAISPAKQDLPLGLRRPRSDAERKELGQKLLDLTVNEITVGDQNAEYKFLFFMSGRTIENWVHLQALISTVSHNAQASFRLIHVPIVYGEIDQFSKLEKYFYCATHGSVTDSFQNIPQNSQVALENHLKANKALTSCIQDPHLQSILLSKANWAFETAGIVDTPTIIVLHNGQWVTEYNGVTDWVRFASFVQENLSQKKEI